MIVPKIYEDDRGFFMEFYHVDKFAKAGVTTKFVQDNHSSSTKNVLRGLHYQCKVPQGKLIRVVKGEIFDVAVDIRKDSKYFGKWVAEILSESNRKQMYIPEGFAHGFCVLSKNAEVQYKTTSVYCPEYDRGIIWKDPLIGIDWPIKDPILSMKDKDLPLLNDCEL